MNTKLNNKCCLILNSNDNKIEFNIPSYNGLFKLCCLNKYYSIFNNSYIKYQLIVNELLNNNNITIIHNNEIVNVHKTLTIIPAGIFINGCEYIFNIFDITDNINIINNDFIIQHNYLKINYKQLTVENNKLNDENNILSDDNYVLNDENNILINENINLIKQYNEYLLYRCIIIYLIIINIINIF